MGRALAGTIATLMAPLVPFSIGHTQPAAQLGSQSVADRCTAPPRSSVADRPLLWAAPLDRVVTVRFVDLTLREALDEVARASQIEFSYSQELLPEAARICLRLERTPVGALLDLLLAGTALRPIVLGTSQVVLAPSRVLPAQESLLSRRPGVLDRVVVTGTPGGAAHRGSPFSMEVIDAAALQRANAGTLGDVLELAIPGIWTWSPAAGSATARYASIRGASSFGVTAPKIYIDGIETANPTLVTQLDPSRIERVEVIRGPQGAALYGADAISGVVNIFTRHDGTPTGAPTYQLTTTAGVSKTSFAPRDAFVQEHAFSARAGGRARNAGVGITVGTVGEYVPGASARRLLADADARLVRSRAVFTGTARLSLQDANASSGVLFEGADSSSARSAPVRDSLTGQDLVQYTVGGTVVISPNLRWTHTLIAGVDGSRVRGLSVEALTDVASNVSALGAQLGDADRGTFRWRSAGRFDLPNGNLLALTLGAEQSVIRDAQQFPALSDGARVGGSALGLTLTETPPLDRARWSENAGVLVQANYAWRDRWFVTAGGRAERTTGATRNTQQALLPMLGTSYVVERGNVVVKVRGAYGTAIRPARTLAPGGTTTRAAAYQATQLQPESQSGTEVGADLLLGAALSLHATRFDQRASGLIQPVSTLTTATGAGGRSERTMSYSLQNIGAITNVGWELQARTRWRGWTSAAALSFVDSRVDQLAAGYLGDLRQGDRVLDVPAATLSMIVGYTQGRFSLSTGVTRVSDWIGYDRLAINAAVANPTRGVEPTGPSLRQYWLRYSGITRWRTSANVQLWRNFTAVFHGENLLNEQQGAPDNASVTAGRTISLGFRTVF